MSLTPSQLTLLRNTEPATSELIVSRPTLFVRHVIAQTYDKATRAFTRTEAWVLYDYAFERVPVCMTSDPTVLAELIKIESEGAKPGALRTLLTGYEKWHEEKRAKDKVQTDLLTNLEIEL